MHFRHTRSLSLTASALLLGVAPLATFPACSRAESNTDYGQVAMYVADMLQKTHYSRKDFDDEISSQLLTTYLDFLDFNHQYFTGEDIEKFDKLYRLNLDDEILVGKIDAAHVIYDTFVKRVEDRVAKVRSLLESEKFTFDSDRSVMVSRKDAPWPADLAAADVLWRDIIEGDLLQEKLRLIAGDDEEDNTDENPDDAIPESEDPDDADDAGEEADESPEAKILKRYDGFLESLRENEEEDVVNFFLSSLSSAYDPHSDWFSQSEMDNFNISMKNSLFGIGALLQMKDGAAEIQGIVMGGPAQRSGELQIGDRIVGVGQGKEGAIEDVMYMKLQKIVEKIRGEKDSVVRLRVLAADADDPSLTREIALVRDEVHLKDKLATAELIETKSPLGETAKLGWIELPSFYADMEERTTSTTEDVSRLLDRLMAENIDGLVLDLRGNGGGSLEEAISLTGLFIPRGPVVQSKDWRGKIDARGSKNRYPIYQGPMIVLTDRASASASEILAAALQDYNRAVIVGEKSTFGKGTVQTILRVAQYMPMFSERTRAGALKVTIQKFYRIAGGSTQLRGVVPDLQIPSRRDPLEIGEDSLDNPLPYDEIPQQEYQPTSATALVGEELRTRHRDRIAKEPEFQYIAEDIQRLVEQIEKNDVSLNEEARLAEVERNKARREAREASREARIADIEKNGKDRFRAFSLTLDNVDEKTLTPSAEFSDVDATGMILADDRQPGSEDSMFPYGINPSKLETILILQDMIELERAAHTAKVNVVD